MRLISRIGGRHHNDSVVTSEVSWDGQTLLTGCEDGFLRVFEVRTRQLVGAIEPWRLAGLEASHPPVSIALSSAANGTASISDDPGGTTVFCAVGCKVVCMDLRALRGDSTGLVAEPRSGGAVPGPDTAETGGQEASQELLQACLETNDDDINQLALSGDGHLLAAVDDSGQVALLDFSSEDPEEDSDLVEGGHAAICSSVAFLPHRRNSFITGGLDHTVVQWQGGEVVGSWSMAHLPEVLGSATQLVNPPMVHALDTSPLPPQCWGAVAAAACGSGHVALLRLPCLEAEEEGEAAALTHPTAVNGVAHSRGASAVRFLSGTGGVAPDWLVSGGNDQQLLLWDVRAIAEHQGSWPEAAQRCTLAASAAHGSKANYLASAAGSSRVYVAATSKHVGEYLLD